VRWLRAFIEAFDLRKITMVCQDWGGSLGLRILAEQPERFVRLVAMNTGISIGDPRSEAFYKWRRFSQRVESLDVPELIRSTLKKRQLSDAEAAAYGAPFPSKDYTRPRRSYFHAWFQFDRIIPGLMTIALRLSA
jgi:haloalkane dehalogenase